MYVKTNLLYLDKHLTIFDDRDKSIPTLYSNDRKEFRYMGVNVIYTVTANCQDCYRCVRVCPVKAIKVKNGQAYIEDSLCIKCGTCIRECPQGAKTVRSGIEDVKALFARGKKVAASLAPSFPSLFSGWQMDKLPSALRQLGFAQVLETAEGGKLIAEEAMEKGIEGGIGTACPAVVNYIEMYKPEHVERLTPLVSPMIAHGRYLKKNLGEDWAVVFIGPCAAKKDEAEREEYKGIIDVVLTFTELKDWLEEESIDLAECPDGETDSDSDIQLARLFPLEGGMLKAGQVDYDGTAEEILCLSGADSIMELLDLPYDEWGYSIVEPLFCSGGCINGPCLKDKKNYYLRKQELLNYSSKAKGRKNRVIEKNVSLMAEYKARPVEEQLEPVSEEKIQEILESTGKGHVRMQLNCGACGYKTCRDNAIAVARGMAEPDMCIPYMRRLAQQRTDAFIETSPNGIVILDDQFHIIHINPAFKELFSCSNSLLGRHVSAVVDVDSYEQLSSDKSQIRDSIKVSNGVKYHEIIYALAEERQYVGIYTDVSHLKFDTGGNEAFKKQTLEHVKKLLEHQISFSQEMAHYLGKSTAESEELVRKIASEVKP